MISINNNKSINNNNTNRDNNSIRDWEWYINGEITIIRRMK